MSVLPGDGDAVASTSTLPQPSATTFSTPTTSKAGKGKKRARNGDAGTTQDQEDSGVSLAYIPSRNTTLEDFTEAFWKQQFHIAENVCEDFKMPELPLARIKRVIKLNPEVSMIASEVPLILEKACQIFISDLTARAYIESSKRRTLTKADIAKATKQSDIFDFLIDVVVAPTEPEHGNSSSKKKKRQSKDASRNGSNEDGEEELPAKVEEEDDFDVNGLLAGGGTAAVDEEAVNDHLLNFDEAIDVTLPEDFSQGIFGLVG